MNRSLSASDSGTTVRALAHPARIFQLNSPIVGSALYPALYSSVNQTKIPVLNHILPNPGSALVLLSVVDSTGAPVLVPVRTSAPASAVPATAIGFLYVFLQLCLYSLFVVIVPDVNHCDSHSDCCCDYLKHKKLIYEFIKQTFI